MAYTTINKSTDYFRPKLYTGNGSARSITFDESTNMQPDLMWIKSRTTAASWLSNDAVRGATKRLKNDKNEAEATQTAMITAFNTNGFSLGDSSTSNANNETFASWNWKAGTTSGLSGGTITPSAYSFNTTSKFGIYKYTGNNTSGATVPHGLGAVPKLILVKRLETTGSWQVLGNGAGQPGPNSYGLLNSTDGFASNANRWNNTAPTTSVFSLGNSAEVNASGGTYIAYVWCDVTGFFKAGLYNGNNSADGPFIHTGGKPRLIMIRPNIAGKNWFMYDNKRNGLNSNTDATTNKILWLSSTNTEAQVGTFKLDILSNGFKIRETGTDTNGSGNSYQYWCWMQSQVGSNNVATTAR